MLRNILSGVIGGALASLVGWLKNRDVKTDQQEKFDLKYMVVTTAIGAALGALSVLDGIDTTTLKGAFQQVFGCFATVAGGEMVLKAGFRQAVPRIMDLLGAFKKA